MNQIDWTEKIAIVTGGGGGMGQAAAKRFADAGARTFVFGRTLESLRETAALSPNIVPVVCDVADPASVAEAMKVVREAGPPFALIHTAGVNTPDRFLSHADPSKEASAETWKKVMEINVLGVVHMLQAVSGPMAEAGGGRIVVVSSTAGHGFDSFAGVPYTASKWAVHGLLFTARAQLSAHGIALSEYAPGESNTPIVKMRPVQPTPEHKAAMIQTGDCAEALFFIASQAHTMGVIQLPLYQPFGGMPPQVPTPWLPGLEIKPA
ncbi:MAG: SDR family oxidoreductase [Akkermansiaceae bacterium]|nr:SDR family oxidoreductase [Akkermansiaceae bacterium]MCP5551615.1 SDR family oxidoreductase [Akkermansiaceae bacterium]